MMTEVKGTARALFEHYPGLAQTLAHTPLADLPAPVARWEGFARDLDVDAVWVKCDDVTGAIYGGNKVRKLEFLLGRAVAAGAGAVITFGAAGSNHALATAIYARALGLDACSMLVPQHNAHTVRRNLLRGYAAGALLRHHANKALVAVDVARQIRQYWKKHGHLPHLIPPGGTSPIGIVGYVNAALELADQIAAGELPQPDRIYVASGTMGTCVGLCLGFQLAGLAIPVHAIRVTRPSFSNDERARRLHTATVKHLRAHDASVPEAAFPDAGFVHRHEFYGEDYALYTEASVAAVRRVRETEGVRLEGTYTGKALAALMADAAQGALHGQKVLFWNTYNSREVEDGGLMYTALPEAVHRYFEEAVQALDVPMAQLLAPR
ncbi:MAG: pyridoxal-phosphate dependent enzyme [Candidatus Hydrogenedentes bacterium]|nr:pyridoxal-phosphate dependent enzyme [Candidatus Hydrogenedentota bacterium]